MSKIVTTKAFVLRKTNYGDTSKIVSLFTKDYGKISAIVKGGRSAKSKIGGAVDLLNLLSIVFYKKENRDVQLITQADLISHYAPIKEDFEKIKYATAVLELINKLILEDEVNYKMFKGTERIFDLFATSNEAPNVLFLKYFLFFIKELGYHINHDKCHSCENELVPNDKIGLNYELGFYCSECMQSSTYSVEFSKELFRLLHCLNLKNCGDIDINLAQRLIIIFERYLQYHIPEFNGLSALHLF